MLRLTLILCIGMYAALMIAGEDRGQLRPGLAEAAARGATPGSNQVTGTEPVAVAETAEVELTPVETQAEPVVETAVAVEEPDAVELATAPDTAALPEADPAVITELREPIFSLSSVGNEAVPGAEEAAAAREPVPETAPDGEGTIWYVNANSVNVRSEPSTSAEIVGRLGTGEATLVVQSVDDDWARIVIQGDGVEGFVAMRYLSAEAP